MAEFRSRLSVLAEGGRPESGRIRPKQRVIASKDIIAKMRGDGWTWNEIASAFREAGTSVTANGLMQLYFSLSDESEPRRHRPKGKPQPAPVSSAQAASLVPAAMPKPAAAPARSTHARFMNDEG
jgi:hypothetical protein